MGLRGDRNPQAGSGWWLLALLAPAVCCGGPVLASWVVSAGVAGALTAWLTGATPWLAAAMVVAAALAVWGWRRKARRRPRVAWRRPNL